MDYQPLEPGLIQSFGVAVPTFKVGQDASLFTSSSFLYTFAFVIIIVTASFRYALAGMLRMQASEEGIKKSKEEFTRVTYGLLGVLGLWLVLFTVNKDMLTGNVTLSGLTLKQTSGGGGLSIPSTTPGSGGGSSKCSSPESTISSINSGNICTGTSCKILSGCNYQKYLPMLKSAAGGNQAKLKMLIVIMCKESTANPTATHVNTNGSYDCGLMQINIPKGKTCNDDPSIFDPQTNINKGMEILSGKMNTPVYPGIPASAGVFASYNCCSTGNPNDRSLDCNSTTGFNSPVPKWGCPINPGDTVTNMCFVKNYACELDACLSDPSLNSI